MMIKMKLLCCICLSITMSFHSPDTMNVSDQNEMPVIQSLPKVEIANDVAEIRENITPKISESYEISEEEILEEGILGDMEMISQLVQAEAGNQDLTGMRYVVDVVLNRVDSDEFPNTVEEVIYQEDQFSVIKNGMFDKAGWNISEEAFEAVRLEYENRTNNDILYFSRGKSIYMSNGSFKYQDHWYGW